MQNYEFWNSCLEELERIKVRREEGKEGPELVEPEGGVTDEYYNYEGCVATI